LKEVKRACGKNKGENNTSQFVTGAGRQRYLLGERRDRRKRSRGRKRRSKRGRRGRRRRRRRETRNRGG